MTGGWRGTIDVPSPEATRQLGAALGRAAQPGDLLLLEGPFGAGKTTLVQGLAEGLGVTDAVTSPSFVLEHRHRGGRLVLYHVDLYRIEALPDELAEQLEEDLFGSGVAAVEWPEILPPDWLATGTRLRIESETGGGRRVSIETAQPHLWAAWREAAERRVPG